MSAIAGGRRGRREGDRLPLSRANRRALLASLNQRAHAGDVEAITALVVLGEAHDAVKRQQRSSGIGKVRTE